jgi:hypothetical protein
LRSKVLYHDKLGREEVQQNYFFSDIGCTFGLNWKLGPSNQEVPVDPNESNVGHAEKS